MMAAEAPVSREALFQTICEHWQRTEDAMAAVGDQFEKKAHEGWSVGDIFRHITALSHDTSSHVRAMIASGEFPVDPANNQEANQVGIDKFASLDYKMLRIELNTAHGVVWMYIQRFSDDDLAQEYSIAGNSFSLGGILGLLAQHEAQHVTEALAAAGVEESAVVPLETAHRWA
tara:strand:- start:406 stop:927 length:522 start_codon:yes stop_codon:yes gene_type:complete